MNTLMPITTVVPRITTAIRIHRRHSQARAQLSVPALQVVAATTIIAAAITTMIDRRMMRA